MKTFFRTTALSSFACLCMAAAPTTLAAESLEIRDFIGTINWSNGEIDVDVQKNKGDLKISKGRSVAIDGGVDRIKSSDCKSSYGRYNIDWFGKKKKGRFGGFDNLEDYPVLNITLPADTVLVVRDSVIFTSGKPDLDSADIELPHCGFVELGNVKNTLKLDGHGSADVSVGDMGGVAANLRGSGDLTGGDTGEVILKSMGSGDVELGNTSLLDLNLHGSGDFEALDIDGDVDISSHGSGDVELGNVGGNLNYLGHGSGDLEVSFVTGSQLSLKSNGSGDVDIAGGEVNQLMVNVSGSATVEYAGETESANLSTSGSGDIIVDRVKGRAKTKSSGSGDVDIGQRR